MNLILTMAGKYSRFLNEGYGVPKFLLPWGDKTILSEILKEMTPNFKKIYLIVNKKDSRFFPHIKSIMLKYSIPQKHLITIDVTSSQSETVLKGINYISDINGPIFIHNIDTILYGRDYKHINKIIESSDGFIDTFTSSNHNYSYVMMESDRVTDIVEKVLITDKASSGFYGFNCKETFIKYYNNNYISDIFKGMLNDGLDIKNHILYDENNTIVLGTPEEYFNLSNNLKH